MPNKPLKICRVYPFFQSDMHYLEHYLTKALKPSDCPTFFISSNSMRSSWANFVSNTEQFKKPHETYNNYEVFRFKSFSIAGQLIPKNLFKIKKLLLEQEPDIIHLAGISNLFTHIIVLLALSIKKQKTIIIFNDHSNPSETKQSFSRWVYYKVHYLLFSLYKKSVYKVIAPNTASAELLKKRYSLGSDKLEIIPLGYDQDNYYYVPELKNKEADFIIGFAGKVEPRKKIERLIDAVSRLDTQKIRIIIVGVKQKDEYIRKLETMAQKLNVRLELRSFASRAKDLREFYNYVDLSVFPGSISITTNEATACGTPVVIFNSIKGLDDRVDGNRGLLFNTDAELQKAIKFYLSEQIDHYKIAESTQKYSWDKVANIYMKHYTRSLVYKNH